MLTIGRRIGETIVLHTTDGEIVIHIHELKSNRVTLAIDAPLSVRILRGEIVGKEVFQPKPEDGAA